MTKHLRPVLSAILAVVAVLAVVLVPAPREAEAQTPSGVIYGIDDNSTIWEIDPVNRTINVVNETGLSGLSNSMGYDSVRDQFFFIWTSTGDAIQNSLRFWDRSNTGPTTVPEVANQINMGLTPGTAQPANAAFYDDAYWFIPSGSSILHKVEFNYTGDAPTGTTLDVYDLSTYVAPTYIPGGFGDIAITNTGILYGSQGQGGRFFSINLSLLGSTANIIYTEIKPPEVGVSGLQLSFSSDYSTLYGHFTEGGTWHTVDVTTGDITSLDFATAVTGARGFRDLGGASTSRAASACAISSPATTNNQSAVINTPVDNPLAVVVTDSTGEPVEGVGVTFTVTTGEGSIDGGTTASAVTNASGIATSPAWTLGPFVAPNTVTASAGTLCSLVFTATGEEVPNPSIRLSKTVISPEPYTVGSIIRWMLVATNTGNVALNDVTIEDAPTFGSTNCGTLQRGDSCSLTVGRPITQDDVNAGQVSNSGEASGMPEGDLPEVTDNAGATTDIPRDPAISLSKTASDPLTSNAGEGMSYNFVATNTGNVTLTGVTISDPLAGLSSLTCAPVVPAILQPGETLSCTATYTVTQSNVNDGGVSNTATVTGTPPTGLSPVSNTGSANVTLTRTPALSFTKTVTVPEDMSAGDNLTYGFVATNTGNVTLTGVGVTDPLLGMSAVSCSPAAPAILQPGGTITCSATYPVTQGDIDTGTVSNTATATGTPPTGPAITRTSTAVATIAQNGEIDLVKTSVVPDLAFESDITYNLVAVNTGNVTLSNVLIDDQLSGLSELVCDVVMPTVLAPGQTLTCSAAYPVTQVDLDAGSVVNRASATGQGPNGISAISIRVQTTDVPQNPNINLVKTGTGPTNDAKAGDPVAFRFLVTNTGNVTLADVTLADAMEGMTPPECDQDGPVTLAPTETLECEATYSVRQADMDAGGISNTASVVGTPPNNLENITHEDDAFVPLEGSPSMSLRKTLSGHDDVNNDGFVNAGDILRWNIVARNTGTVSLDPVRIVDELTVDALDCGLMPPLSTCIMQVEYIISVQDVRVGSVVNAATVTGIDPSDITVEAEAQSTIETNSPPPPIPPVPPVPPSPTPPVPDVPSDGGGQPGEQTGPTGVAGVLPTTGATAVGLVLLALTLIGIGGGLTLMRSRANPARVKVNDKSHP